MHIYYLILIENFLFTSYNLNARYIDSSCQLLTKKNCQRNYGKRICCFRTKFKWILRDFIDDFEFISTIYSTFPTISSLWKKFSHMRFADFLSQYFELVNTVDKSTLWYFDFIILLLYVSTSNNCRQRYHIKDTGIINKREKYCMVKFSFTICCNLSLYVYRIKLWITVYLNHFK